MAKVLYAKLQTSKTSKPLPSKRIKGADGTMTVVHAVNADSATFGEDLLQAFRLNVRRAKDRNKRLARVANPG